MTRKNQLVAVAAGIIIIVLGLGGYFLYGNNSTPKTVPTNTQAAQPTSTTNSMQASIKDLFSSGDTKQCTFNTTGTNGSSTKGTVYVYKTSAAGQFESTVNGKATTTHLIKNDDTYYIWGDALPTGIKITMNMDEMTSKMQGTGMGTNPDQKYSADCKPWTADLALFTPPANIKFTDTGSLMMPKTSGTITPNSGKKTDPCVSITDPTTKAACQSAVKSQGY